MGVIDVPAFAAVGATTFNTTGAVEITDGNP